MTDPFGQRPGSPNSAREPMRVSDRDATCLCSLNSQVRSDRSPCCERGLGGIDQPLLAMLRDHEDGGRGSIAFAFVISNLRRDAHNRDVRAKKPNSKGRNSAAADVLVDSAGSTAAPSNVLWTTFSWPL